MKPLHSLLTPQLISTYSAYAAALVVRGMELVGKLGLYMIAARILGAHEAGLFFLCITWIGLISTVARAGFEKAIIRHMAAELALGKEKQARIALFTGVGWATLGGALATALTVLFAHPLSTHVFGEPDLGLPLAVSAAVILPQTLCIVIGHALSGLNRGVAAQFIQNGLWPVLTLAAVAAGITSLNGMLLALGAANLAATLVGLYLILRHKGPLHTPSPDDPPEEVLPALWRTAFPLGVVEVVQVSLNSIPVLVLGVFASASDVGAFSVANRISMLIWVVIISIGTIAAPSFAALHRRGEWDALRTLNRRVRAVVALCGIPVIAAMMIFPAQVLHLIGPGFESASTALVIMGVGQLINCLLPCQDIVLAMTGHGGVLRWLNTAQLATCCLLGAVLIPLFGMTGAAVLTAIFIAQGAIGTTLVLRRLLPRAF
ncbi:MAG TPA: oligosaccharide flippase family protein [Xanthobacteraceae bacterium]|jgi:O-antigen/teichoic acid export membrane protein|nr:MAG: polysaccharide biosynthesis protein [Rhizobiales bacterium 39-66-18]HQS08337.1 oligosaccharide flippase family protein [Xanthobacteraceae bacterium]